MVGLVDIRINKSSNKQNIDRTARQMLSINSPTRHANVKPEWGSERCQQLFIRLQANIRARQPHRLGQVARAWLRERVVNNDQSEARAPMASHGPNSACQLKQSLLQGGRRSL